MPNTLFFMTLVSGTVLSISSSSWFGAWVGLELNLLSFIPLMILKNNQYSSEAALKYFLIQALGSSLIIFSASLLMAFSTMSSVIMFWALVLKLGGAPFHFWLPQVLNGLMWPQAMILMTIQKIAPLFLICYLMALDMNHIELYLSGMASSVIGAIGGINQTSLRKILAFSSINHIGWMLSSLLISENMMMNYFVFYCLISLSIVVLLQLKQIFHFNHLLNFDMTIEMKTMIFMSLLSLGGLPPFTGFIPKWMIIQELAETKNFLLLMVLLMSALVTLYFYLRVSTLFFTLSSNKLIMPMKSNPKSKRFISYLVIINFFGLLMPFLFLIT